jgi:hypothetical protein
MPSIHEIAQNIDNAMASERHTHLEAMYKHTGRNVICYYSGFLTSQKAGGISIDDNDLHGIMSTVHKLNKKIGLDLILHTPGGDATATESIVSYLRSIFGDDIRAIVPHMAMSAGTMLACSCKEIIMAKHSSLGPIDPQYGGIPALDIVEEFESAKNDLTTNPEQALYWKILLEKYPVAFLGKCNKAIQLSEDLVKTWLSQNMLKGQSKSKINGVLKVLNENKKSKTHSRHFDTDKCKAAGLNIVDLEADQDFQDIVLSIHHCYMHFFMKSKCVKIIENHIGIAVVVEQK